MRKGSPGVQIVHERIDRAQAHGMIQVLKRQLRLTAAVLYETGAIPSLRKVWIEGESALDERGSRIDVADDTQARNPGAGQRDSVILSKLNGAFSQMGSLARLLLAVDHPSVYHALGVTQRRHAIGRGKIRIDLDRPVE